MGESVRKLLRRRDVPGTARFLTFSCYRRLRLFDNDRIKDRFIERLALAVERHEWSVLAWVVMPEHVHLIVYSEVDQPLRAFLQTLKDPFAREVIARWRVAGFVLKPWRALVRSGVGGLSTNIAGYLSASR